MKLHIYLRQQTKAWQGASAARGRAATHPTHPSGGHRAPLGPLGTGQRHGALQDKGWSITASPASLPAPDASGSKAIPSLRVHPQH